MKKNIIIFLTFFVFIVSYFYYNNFTFAKIWIDPGDSVGGSTGFILCRTYEEAGCPWGDNYNSNVGIRTVRIYSDSNCSQYKNTDHCLNGDANCIEVDDPWSLSKECNDCQYCHEEAEEYICKQDYAPLLPTRDGATVNRPATLDWCNLSNADYYKVKVCEKWWENNNWERSCFDILETMESVLCTSFLSLSDSNDRNGSRYEWEVAPCSNDWGCSAFGDKWTFYIDGRQDDLGKPSLISPDNNSSVDIPVTIEWSEVAGANSYYVTVYDENENKIAFEAPNTTNTILTVNNLTNDTEYTWKVAACFGKNGNACGQDCCYNELGDNCEDISFSSSKKFTTNSENTQFNKVQLLSPDDGASAVRPSDIFKWQSLGATGFMFQILKGSEILRIDTQNSTTTLTPSLDFNWKDSQDANNKQLAFNTEYIWKVTPSWWDNGETAYHGTSYATEQAFTTAGGQIITSTLSPYINTNPSIPVLFTWEKVPNAFSYSFILKDLDGNLIGNTITAEHNQLSLDYPTLQPNTYYSWFVKACAENNGSFCEDNWHTQNFLTKEFVAPTSKQLEDGEVFSYENSLIWEPASSAKSYRYELKYDGKSLEEFNNNCVATSTPIQTGLIDSNYFLMPNFPGIQQKCLGEYSLTVLACLNKDCDPQSPESITSASWTFNYSQSESSQQGGIMPCNRNYDMADTPWNERESCKLKHIPVLFYNIVDFLLWEASLIALVCLVIASAIYSYASAGLPIKVVSLKNIWVAAGKGYAVMFLAWTIISLALKLLGITDSFFLF